MLHLVTSKNPIHHADKGLENIEGLFTDLTSKAYYPVEIK